MIVDGKKIAERIADELRKKITGKQPTRLAAILIGNNAVSEKFVELKKKFGEKIGIKVDIFKFPSAISETTLCKAVSDICSAEKYGGVIVQLPLPPHINDQKILNLIPINKDIDIISEPAFKAFANGDFELLPPVVGAINEIFKEFNIDLNGKRAVVVGYGRLVGKPAAIWLKKFGAQVEIIDENSKNPKEIIRQADIIISGVGKPGLIKLNMVKQGAIVIDAGASNDNGITRGDVDFNVSETASIFTPVPGGIGPITIAMIFKNLLEK